MTDTARFVQQVKHWIHDEQNCVTVQRIVQTFGLSWAQASAVLKEVPDKAHEYNVTLFGRGDAGKNDNSTSSKFCLIIYYFVLMFCSHPLFFLNFLKSFSVGKIKAE